MKTYSSLPIERTILMGFLSVIATGALFIWAFGFTYERHISFVDALFTATSATCVTGLTVTDTALLPFPSQAAVLLLIQLGGIGIMTATNGVFLLLRRRIGIREGLYLAGGLSMEFPSGAKKLVLRVCGMTLLLETLGGVVLYLGFRNDFPPLPALWYAAFHSISAFCNAGFSTFSDNLVPYARTLLIPGIIMLLITFGGFGFPVVYEIGSPLWGEERPLRRLSPHAFLVLLSSALLVVGGAALFLKADADGSLATLPSAGWKIWNALFMSVSSRTAGFNSVSMNAVSDLGAFILIFLMIIGASPGSTGGGMKTTTFGLLWLSVFSTLRGEENIVFRDRTIPSTNATLASTVATLYISAVLVGGILLSLMEPYGFRAMLFESASAMGTVGLSLDITPQLGSKSKCVLVLLMLWGRVGILTFIYSFIKLHGKPGQVAPAETGIPVG